jgi:hypothetical protein
MVEYHVPKADEFKNGARREFLFLLTEFGFKECDSPFKYENPYSICYENKDVFVYIEGLSYGFALGVDIGKFGTSHTVEERISLGYIVSLRNPKLLEPKFPEKRGQLEQMKQSASNLKQCAYDFLSGDFTDLPRMKVYIEEQNIKNKAQCEADELNNLGIKASKAFHSKNYKQVIELLQPMEQKLSKAQSMLLTQSKKRL